MKCFHFPSSGTSGERGVSAGGGGDDGSGSLAVRVPWARTFSFASSSSEARRSGFESGSREDGDYSPPATGWWQGKRPEGLRAFGFAELKAATRGFSRTLVIGEGGFGCVYRGVISVSGEGNDGGERGGKTMDVAVKQLNRHGWQGHREWITEVDYLGVLKHPNLVKLIGYCAEDDERGIQRLLVYEFMPNKSLEDHLLARVPSNLSWAMRLKIARGAACGLAYLHEEMDFQLIFRDFKSSNILLDEEFNAKLSDFGLARHGPAGGLGHISTPVVGTVGYAAPEYVHLGRLTAKSDVYSFGVVLYELVTGRRSIDRNLPRTEQKLLDWVKPYVSDPKKLHIIVDPRIEGKCSMKSVQKLINLANKCSTKRPKSRPRMSAVVEMLNEIIETSNKDSVARGASSDMGDFDGDDEGKMPLKESCSYRNRILDIKELISLRRTVSKLEWKALAPGSLVWLSRA
ncbi:putative receptor-like protein kinase [Apostasia shenzhenica]|uniref:non-specific serine/threonine protein kinase n=1 Tax=Apostasia shenzhenica TaxID=1088818 RepID=A0A2I0A8U0_9ASPA|nr:putative receptor-like protein kinase [Apostasia shenzhenica]